MKIVLIVLLLLVSNSAVALSLNEWEKVARHGRLSSSEFFALTLKESGRMSGSVFLPTPFAIRAGNESYYLKTKYEAKLKIDELTDRGFKYIDVGLAQVNLGFHSHRVKSVYDLLDPDINLKIAADILRECYKRFPTKIGMLSCYNTGKLTERGKMYAKEVLSLANSPRVTSWSKNNSLYTKLSYTTKIHRDPNRKYYGKNWEEVLNKMKSKRKTSYAANE